MPIQLKPLSPEGVAGAIEKAKHYRLLNEPMQAESICRDVLEVEPDNRAATITLILALTDQFEGRLGGSFSKCQKLLKRLKDPYARDYYAGIVAERRAIAHMKSGVPGSGHVAYEWFREAMDSYEGASKRRPPDDDSAILRWNTCARLINSNPEVEPEPERPFVPRLSD